MNRYYYKFGKILVPAYLIHLPIFMLIGMLLFQTNRYLVDWIQPMLVKSPSVKFAYSNEYDWFFTGWVFGFGLSITGGIIAAISFFALMVTGIEDLIEMVQSKALTIEEYERLKPKPLLTAICEAVERSEDDEKKIVNY